MLEGPLKRRIFRYLKSLPESDWEISPPRSVTGKPDITGCLKGRYVGLEVKTPTGRATRLQLHKLEKLRKAGAVAEVVRSIEAAREVLRDNGLI